MRFQILVLLRPYRILWSKNGNSVLRKCQFCATNQNSAFKKNIFCTQKMQVLHSTDLSKPSSIIWEFCTQGMEIFPVAWKVSFSVIFRPKSSNWMHFHAAMLESKCHAKFHDCGILEGLIFFFNFPAICCGRCTRLLTANKLLVCVNGVWYWVASDSRRPVFN